MQQIDIYRAGTLYVSIKPDEGSTQNKRIMGDNELRLQFRLNYNAPFEINDYCDVFGERYKLYQVPIVNKKGQYYYEYTMTLKAEGFDLERAQFLFYGYDNTLREIDFSMLGTPEQFIDLIIENATRVSTGWVKGQVALADAKNITFAQGDCYTALKRVAEEFGTEFFIEGKKIHLTKRQRPIPVNFKHGQGRGLYEIKRTVNDGSNIFTRLYTAGSNRNLPPDYRQPTLAEIFLSAPVTPPRVPSTRLILGKGVRYLEKNVAKYGVIEHTHIFEDIYPTRSGKLTSVDAADVFQFSDSTMNFDINTHKLPGLVPKITFNSGQLTGYTFDIDSYNHSTRTFKIVKNKDEKSFDVPSLTLKAAIGDQYVLTDIRLPETYLIGAENLLKATAQAYLDANSEPVVAYEVDIDPVFIRDNNISLNIGDLVNLEDVELDVNKQIRITATIRNIVNDNKISIDLADNIPKSAIARAISGVQENSRNISEVNRRMENVINNRFVGNVLVEQGTFVARDIPQAPSGVVPLYLDPATGRIYRGN